MDKGEHKITAVFEDAEVSSTFMIKDKETSDSTPKKQNTTPSNTVVTCQMAGYPSNYSWNEAAKACQPGYLDAGGNFHPYSTPRSRGAVPNTGDNTNNPLYAWIFMLATAMACFCGVRLLHEDWEV